LASEDAGDRLLSKLRIELKLPKRTNNDNKVYFIENNIMVTDGGRRSRDRMVVGFTTTCAISAYHHKSCEFMSRCTLDTTVCDRLSVTSESFGGFLRVLRFSPPIKLTAMYNITEILLKVALNTINQKPETIGDRVSILFTNDVYMSC
jgi:hypothetical protein